MTFEEFFKKKRIGIEALQIADPVLLSEFKAHFEQMGEKSFDHTKKYWFNKLRHEYPAPVEPKTEKVKIDNPLAEQTITDSLEQAAVPAAKGFTPKFRPASAPKPTAEKPAEEKVPEETLPQNTVSKPGFTPRFKAANLSKPADAEAPKPTEEKPAEETSETKPIAPKPGFTPRFKAANMHKPVERSAEGETEKPIQEKKAEDISAQDSSVAANPAVTDAPKPAYKPRFNPKNLPKKEK